MTALGIKSVLIGSDNDIVPGLVLCLRWTHYTTIVVEQKCVPCIVRISRFITTAHDRAMAGYSCVNLQGRYAYHMTGQRE